MIFVQWIDLTSTCRCLPDTKKQLINWDSDLDTIEGPLRLAAKYELTELRDRIASVLETHWPARLRDWDERERARDSWSAYAEDHSGDPHMPRKTVGEDYVRMPPCRTASE